jgi:hypothetical protein
LALGQSCCANIPEHWEPELCEPDATEIKVR